VSLWRNCSGEIEVLREKITVVIFSSLCFKAAYTVGIPSSYPLMCRVNDKQLIVHLEVNYCREVDLCI
jgi:hypothetical protein